MESEAALSPNWVMTRWHYSASSKLFPIPSPPSFLVHAPHVTANICFLKSLHLFLFIVSNTPLISPAINVIPVYVSKPCFTAFIYLYCQNKCLFVSWACLSHKQQYVFPIGMFSLCILSFVRSLSCTTSQTINLCFGLFSTQLVLFVLIIFLGYKLIWFILDNYKIMLGLWERRKTNVS